MIRPAVRSSFTPSDVELALGLLRADADPARDTPDDLDLLWDDPRLVPALLAHRSLAQPSAALLIYAVLRRALLDLGLDDPDVTDYCAAMVLAFGHRDRAYRVGEHDENRYEYLVDLLAEAGRSDGRRRFEVRMHLGNFSLWLSGIFPDYIAARRVSKGGPGLPYYEELGRTGFQMAGDDRLADHYGLGPVLRSAAERFTLLRVALNTLSDRMMFPGVPGPDRLLRQVADGFNHGLVH